MNNIITSSSGWLSVFNQPTYVFTDQAPHGSLRISGVGNLEVYTESWIPVAPSTISLSPHAEEVLSWASRKMIEERELEDLCNKNPALKDAKNAYEMMLALVKEHNNG